MVIGELLLTGLPPDGASAPYLKVNAFSAIEIARGGVFLSFSDSPHLAFGIFHTHCFSGALPHTLLRQFPDARVTMKDKLGMDSGQGLSDS